MTPTHSRLFLAKQTAVLTQRDAESVGQRANTPRQTAEVGVCSIDAGAPTRVLGAVQTNNIMWWRLVIILWEGGQTLAQR